MFPSRPRTRADCGAAAQRLSVSLRKIYLLCRRRKANLHWRRNQIVWTLMSWRNPCRLFDLCQRAWLKTAPEHPRNRLEGCFTNGLRLNERNEQSQDVTSSMPTGTEKRVLDQAQTLTLTAFEEAP